MEILHIEDDMDDRRLLACANEQLTNKCRIICVACIAEAEHALNGESVIISDLTLPDSTPSLTIDWLTALNKPVLVMTGSNDPSLFRRLGRLRMPWIYKGAMNAQTLVCALSWCEGFDDWRAVMRGRIDTAIESLDRAEV